MKAGQSNFSKWRQCLRRVLPAIPLLLAGLVALSAPVHAASEPRSGTASIRTPDFDETVAWYEGKLGFRLLGSRNAGPGRRAVLERSGFLLEINEADHILQPDSDTTAGIAATKVPVVTLLVSDVDREVARLGKAGVDILQPPQDELDGTYRTAQIRDNGRHRIELREPLDDPARFHPQGR
ncbi:catechol 2,3-dioxygenase-like lactoylglutathione lyase family enzyme [Microvirga flocculans]|uniref:Catechol 2,3-dioxygenase-like lactoylglutathione lyase family enzyme n=1 Tax=Microvirga flocculans TaxID=217168 RepID=A0A7W6N7U6_9HYPH|nr:VOC family protein [Microvirga flocculans]MBB4040037.1 catechol 2,3-dioxygenase-like lactoylglutathione lyase family enzyme [Microvirga flocculans]